jgi:dTDP-4-dehydrorhamnose reductase
MVDNAIGFLQLIERSEPGHYHRDSNVNDRLSFYDLVCLLKSHYKTEWKVGVNGDYRHDQRLQDERIALPPLSARFGEPKS